ncbi:hypothetical protein BGX28_004589 [Mortierella sp. GBA30]|nr:hypothetical protein BGX28_004589 [Mortierella sp. GBA30]
MAATNITSSTVAPIPGTASEIKVATYKKAAKEKPDQKYAPTLLLPKTDFPLRADAAVRESLFRQRCTTDLYAWQREQNPGDLFVLHDGPPYANGRLHLGHALNKLLKDFVNRQRVMKGFKVDYRPGWDCHGLPIELKALAELKVTDRSNLSPTEVRSVAQATAQSAVDSQRDEFSSYAVMADWQNSYRTMDKDFETRQLIVFYKMMNKGLIYRANKPVYWSPSSKTALAESELEYKDDHKSRSAWVAFFVEQPSPALAALSPNSVSLQAVVWTTTPWTLPANRCVAVHPEMNYTLFRSSTETDPNTVYLAATDRMDEMKKRFASKDTASGGGSVVLEEIAQITGQELVGSRYQHPLTTESLPFITADYVTSDSGSGLVHTAPGHGMEDYKACYPLGIEAFCPVDNVGDFTAEAGSELAGLHVQTDGTAKVLEMLVAKGTLIQEQLYVHKYPYDWRTKKPVILRATSQWFANVGTIKEDALNAIERVRIIPEGARRRLEGFVLSRSEWCISRQRSWGVPIPVMYDVDTDEPLLTQASVQHIIDTVEKHGADAWWSMTTEELLASEYRNNGKTYRRGTDTMDVWFDSGTSWTMIDEKMPRPHLPFVADLYVEGSDQHRGWFQSSLLTSVALTGKAPYGTLITHGFLLDEKGFKQSKSLGNTIDPAVVINGGKSLQKDPAYGTDVLRLWVASSEYTKDVAIGKTILAQVSESLRKFRTTARFMLGNLGGFKDSEAVPYEDMSPLDRFMLSEVYQFCKQVDAAYDEVMFNKVYGHLQYFTSTTLSSFYLDVIKDTLYSESESSLKRRSIQTVLFHALTAFTKSIAPLAPHFAEEVYEHYHHCFTNPQPTIFRSGWFTTSEVWDDASLRGDFAIVKQLRVAVNQLLEQARAAKVIGPSLEATVEILLPTESDMTETLAAEQKILNNVVRTYAGDLARTFITSDVLVTRGVYGKLESEKEYSGVFARDFTLPQAGSCRLVVQKQPTQQQMSTSSAPAGDKRPPVILCIGMAGSGKTTFMQRLNAHLHTKKQPPYILNLDPAVAALPFSANIDIRDTVNYKEVMKQYNLGPNGGILTALNLFTTKFDQVLGFVDKRAPTLDYILVDTPGQIEIFTWSASGSIITDTLAATYPTMIAYIIDTPRTAAPATFMSNMLYACSILYKTKVPFILVFNKTDVKPHDFAVEWMTDFEAFQEALQKDKSYMSSLMNSMSLVLDEFYAHLKVVGVSAVTGAGMDDFLKAVDEAVVEYDNEYRPELERVLEERRKKQEAEKEEQMARLMRDMAMEEKGKEVKFGKSTVAKGKTPLRGQIDDDEEEEEEDEDEREVRYRDDLDSDDDVEGYRAAEEERRERAEEESLKRYLARQQRLD